MLKLLDSTLNVNSVVECCDKELEYCFLLSLGGDRYLGMYVDDIFLFINF